MKTYTVEGQAAKKVEWVKVATVDGKAFYVATEAPAPKAADTTATCGVRAE